MSLERVLVIPLGEAPANEVEAAVRRQFGAVQLAWFDRNQLRREPLRALLDLAQRRHDAAVLVTADLGQSRLRLTSLLLLATRATARWRIDLHGGRETWTLVNHAAQHAAPVARHVLACLLAAALSIPLLSLLDAFIKPRPFRAARPRRLLYLRSQLWLGLVGGGSVAHTAGMIDGLEQAGVAVHAVSSDHLAGVAVPLRIVVPEVWFEGWLRELEDLAYNVAFFVAALQAARGFKPEVLYQRHTAFNVSGALLSRVLRIPLVLEFNSSEVWKGRYWGGLRLVRAAMLVERINLRAADRVVVVSQVLRDELISAGVPSDKIVVNPNGVDPTIFRPDRDGLAVRRHLGPGSEVVVGFSGTFGAWHGIPTLTRALPMVVEARGCVHWLLMGDGPERVLIDRAIEQGDLRRSVTLTGMLPHAQMPDYLAACDILVSPHGTQVDGGEFFGSPTKLYEYMAMGRPIVASRVGQIAEVLSDEASALLVPPDDAAALCRAVVRLVDDPGLRARLGAAAREAAVAHHTWRRNADRVLEALAES